jgi:peptide/nickel transport system permease protein
MNTLPNQCPKLSKKVTTFFQGIRYWPLTLKIGTIIITFIILASLLAPILTPYNPIRGDFNDALASPSWKHLFGTDNYGRDLFSRTLYAARLDIQIGLITTYVPLIIGLLIGTLGGYLGGWADALIMRIVDIFIAFPSMVLIIVMLVILGPGIQNMYFAIFLLGWTMYARLARSETLIVREQEYILAARSLGYGPLRIVFRHAIPNVLTSSIIFSMADLVANILLASSLSFLGLGVQPPTPEWGAIITEGRDFLLQAWWISTLPGLLIIITGLGFSLIGDGLARILGQRNIQVVKGT